jgi:uncharacterized protein (DUF1501 family)
MKKLYYSGLFIISAAIVAAFFLSCAGVQIGSNDDLILSELADTIGYSVGAYCLKDADLRARVEYIYGLYEKGTISPVEALNMGLGRMLNGDLTTNILARKITRLITKLGGEINADFKIVSIVGIDPELLQTAKDAYLQALAVGEV